MADVKISDLTEDTTPADGDFLVTVDVSANASKKVTRTNLFKNPPLANSSITTAMLANSAVTMAKFTNPYTFRAAATGQTGIADNVWTTIAWTETFDTNSNFASNTYTVPVTGRYRAALNVVGSGTAGLYIGTAIRLFKNGTTIVSGGNGPYDNNWSADSLYQSLTDTVSLTAGDTVVAQVLHRLASGTGGVQSGESTTFSMSLVSQ